MKALTVRYKVGDDLIRFSGCTHGLKKRECFSQLQNYINSPRIKAEVCILYGLRRTGKTYLMLQSINGLPARKQSKCAYIDVGAQDTMLGLFDTLDHLHDRNYKYIYIDEVTNISDFPETCAALADYYALDGMKIVLAGTDSLGFSIAENGELYDRCRMIHTTYIPFHEFVDVTGKKELSDYIRYGGTLNIEEQNGSLNRNDVQLAVQKESSSSRNVWRS